MIAVLNYKRVASLKRIGSLVSVSRIWTYLDTLGTFCRHSAPLTISFQRQELFLKVLNEWWPIPTRPSPPSGSMCRAVCRAVVLSHHAVVSFPSAYRHLPQLVPLPRHWHHPRRNIKQRPTKIILKKSSKLHKSMQISTWICRSKMATILDLASTTASLALAMARSWSLDQLESCFDRSKPLVWSKWFIDDHGSSWSVLVYCVIDSLNFDQVVRLSMSQVLCTELPRFFSFRLNQTIKKWSRPRLTKM